MSQHEEWMEQFDALCQDPAIRNRSFYPDFRRGWEALLRKASHSAEQYFDPEAESVFAVACSFGGLDTVFHFDQLKMADWYSRIHNNYTRQDFRCSWRAYCRGVPPTFDRLCLSSP